MIHMYLDNARLINFVLLIAVIAGITTIILVRRDKATRRTRRVMMWIYLIFINFAYATADNLHDNIRINPPVVLSTILLVCLGASMIWQPDGDDRYPPEDGSVGSRLIKWLDLKVRAYKARKESRRSRHPRMSWVHRAVNYTRGR